MKRKATKCCVVCQMRYFSFKRSGNADTCDEMCTRAKKVQRTRPEQLQFEMDEEAGRGR